MPSPRYGHAHFSMIMDIGMGLSPSSDEVRMIMGIGMGLSPSSDEVRMIMDIGMGLSPSSDEVRMIMGIGMGLSPSDDGGDEEDNDRLPPPSSHECTEDELADNRASEA